MKHIIAILLTLGVMTGGPTLIPIEGKPSGATSSTEQVSEPAEPYGGCDEAYLYPRSPGYRDCVRLGLVEDVKPSLSPDDIVFLNRAHEDAPEVDNASAASLLNLAADVRNGWFSGLTVKRLVTAVTEGGLSRPTADRLVRLVLAVYCQPVTGGEHA